MRVGPCTRNRGEKVGSRGAAGQGGRVQFQKQFAGWPLRVWSRFSFFELTGDISRFKCVIGLGSVP